MRKKKLTKLLSFHFSYYCICPFVYPFVYEEEMPTGQGNNGDEVQRALTEQEERERAADQARVSAEAKALLDHCDMVEQSNTTATKKTFFFSHSGNRTITRYFKAGGTGKYQLASQAMEALGGKPYVNLPDDRVIIQPTRALEILQGVSLTLSLAHQQALWAFMKQSCDLMKHTLRENWVSFGVIIGLKDTEITPLSLLRVRPLVGANLIEETGTPTTTPVWDGVRLSAMIALCGLSRLSNASNEAYRKSLAERLSKLTGTGGSVVTPVVLSSRALESLAMSTQYRILCAAIDMFLNYTKNPDLSVLRAGTIGMRYSAMVAAPILCSLTENTERLMDFLKWCKEIEVKKEIERMLDSDNEELNDEHSYTFYAVPMGIITSSLWTASANPNFLWFYHAVHALLGSDRSKNARMMDVQDATTLARSALLFAYIESKRCSVGAGVFASQEEQESFMTQVSQKRLAMEKAIQDTLGIVNNVINVENAPLDPLLREPKPDDSTMWHALSLIPDHPVWKNSVVPWGHSRLESLRNSREGTVGESVRNLVGSAIGHVDRDQRAMGFQGPVMASFLPAAPPQ